MVRSIRSAEKRVWLLLTAAVACLLFLIFQPVTLGLTEFYLDDGFYYRGYARNIALGNGTTFDGIISTNGVQPLWAALLVVAAYLFPDPLALVRVSLVLSIVLVAVSALAMNSVLKHFFERDLRLTLIVVYVAFIAAPRIALSMMELPVTLATFTLALAVVLNTRQIAFSPMLKAGFFVALTTLARIDNLIIFPVFALLFLWRTGALTQLRTQAGRLTAVRAVIAMAVPVVIVFAAYLAFNLATFHRLLPVSGDIKAARQDIYAATVGGHFSPWYLYRTTRVTLEQYLYIGNFLFHIPRSVILLLGILILVLFGIRILLSTMKHYSPITMLRRRFSRSGWIASALIVVVLLFHTWLMSFQLPQFDVRVNFWYYVPEYIFLTLFLGFVLRRVAYIVQVHRPLYALVSAAAAVSFLLVYSDVFVPTGETVAMVEFYAATEYANENIPANDLIGSYDAGTIGYFSDASVINLDGLMNNQEILNVMRRQSSLLDYIRQHNIRWIMNYEEDRFFGTDGIYFKGIPATCLEEVYSQPYDHWGNPATMYIWRVSDSPDCSADAATPPEGISPVASVNLSGS